MDSTNNEKNKKSRRDFLKLGLTLGAGALTGAGIISVFSNAEAQNITGDTTLLTTDGKLVKVDSTKLTLLSKEEEEELFSEQQERGREGIAGKKWVMVIDLSKCRNARKCVDACQTAHQLRPEQYHINTLRMQDTEFTAPYFMPKPCYHCDNPPCTKVCPVDATYKRQDGIVLIDNERCIGCRFCIAACPYSARMFNWIEPKVVDENAVYDVELNVPQKRGTITKCLFSADRLRKGELPYCVSACPNGVFYFGDRNEDAVTNGTTKETVRFSELIRDNAGYTYLEELGTKPAVYYLPPKDRLFPYEEDTQVI
jgi:molybdopterin-containing oxidoreductase family iron-sulfur binding subunit